MAHRERRKGHATSTTEGRIYRLAADASALNAIAVGVLVYTSGVALFAAVQVIATAQVGVGEIAAAVAMVIAINAVLIWLHLLIHFVAAEATGRLLASFNEWLRDHRQTISSWALIVVGAILVGNGHLRAHRPEMMHSDSVVTGRASLELWSPTQAHPGPVYSAPRLGRIAIVNLTVATSVPY